MPVFYGAAVTPFMTAFRTVCWIAAPSAQAHMV
jgi:hypothetical protein